MTTKLAKFIKGVGLAALAGAVVPAMAGNITVADYNPANWTWNSGGVGAGGEDNEVEQTGSLNVIRDQAWDLEAFDYAKVGGIPTLNLVSGFNTSVPGSGDSRPGHLFIKISGPGEVGPGPFPLANPSGGEFRNNSQTDGVNVLPLYDYAVDLLSGTVYDLKPTTMLLSVNYDALASNPWRVNTGTALYNASNFDAISSTSVGFTLGQTAAQIDSALGDTGTYDTLLRNSGQGAAAHNLSTVDLSFLGGLTSANDTIWFHYTMYCGNDMMLGSMPGGFRVPDGGATLLMLGLSLLGTGLAARRK